MWISQMVERLVLTQRVLRDGMMFVLHYIRSNKLRTLLSLLGVMIGIFTIIAIFVVFDSLKRDVSSSLSMLGTNAVVVSKWPWTNDMEYPWWVYSNNPQPSYDDFLAISRRSKNAGSVAISAWMSRTIKHESQEVESAGISGISSGIEQIMRFDMAVGRMFSQAEYRDGQYLCVLGWELGNQLFPDRSPLGQEVQVEGRSLRVIGLLARQGESFTGMSSDDKLVIPYQTMRKMANMRRVGTSIYVQPRAGVSSEELRADLHRVLRATRRLKPKQMDNFVLNESQGMMEEIERMFAVINLAGWLIGGFSILVGGFGIANIMFVSVKERTKIIGIQKALGAKRWFVLLQFLFESTALSLLGGVLGILLLWVLVQVVGGILPFPIVLSGKNILLGLGISCVIGILSGYVPARAASRLDPVVAIDTVV